MRHAVTQACTARCGSLLWMSDHQPRASAHQKSGWIASVTLRWRNNCIIFIQVTLDRTQYETDPIFSFENSTLSIRNTEFSFENSRLSIRNTEFSFENSMLSTRNIEFSNENLSEITATADSVSCSSIRNKSPCASRCPGPPPLVPVSPRRRAWTPGLVLRLACTSLPRPWPWTHARECSSIYQHNILN